MALSSFSLTGARGFQGRLQIFRLTCALGRRRSPISLSIGNFAVTSIESKTRAKGYRGRRTYAFARSCGPACHDRDVEDRARSQAKRHQIWSSTAKGVDFELPKRPQDMQGQRSQQDCTTMKELSRLDTSGIMQDEEVWMPIDLLPIPSDCSGSETDIPARL